MPAVPPPPLLVVHNFRHVRDPRQRYKVTYSLEAILLTVFAAVLSGLDEWEAMALFAHERGDWLRSLVPMPETTPSADTLRRVFERLSPREFARAFEAWTAALAGRLSGEVVAVDGKSVHGAKDAAAPTVPLHLLHVFATRKRLVLAVRAVAGAPGEPAAAAEVLALLELRGAVVTADANVCTGAVARAARAAGADYVLALKGNRGPQHAEAEAAFAALDAAGGGGLGGTHAVAAGRAHGREELRAARSLDAAALPALVAYFPGVRSVTCVERLRRTEGRCAYERGFYVSSLPPDAARVARVVRRHWSVENHLHFALDVVLHEDACRVPKGPAAENLATVRRIALLLLGRDTTTKLSLRKRTQRAALNDAYRRQLLTLGTS